MADEEVVFQSETPATPPAGTSVAVDTVGGKSYQRVKLDMGADGAVSPLGVGQQANAASIPVTLSTEQAAFLDGIETSLTTIDGHVDGIEGLIAATNASLPAALVGGKLSVTTASATTPSWTDGSAVKAIATLAKGAVFRTTFDLTNKPGAYLTIFIGRTGATALDVGIAVRVRRTLALSPIMQTPGANVFSATSDIAAAVSGVCAASGNNAGVTSLTLNAAKTFAAGTNGEIILFVCDDTTTPTTASEFVRQSFATSTTVKLLDAPTISAHNSTSQTVSDKANIWQPWLEGGCIYEVIWDYGAATTGDTVVIGAYAQTLNSMVGA